MTEYVETGKTEDRMRQACATQKTSVMQNTGFQVLMAGVIQMAAFWVHKLCSVVRTSKGRAARCKSYRLPIFMDLIG